MGGTINVTSDLGEGTNFTISFPFNQCFSQKPATVEQEKPVSSPSPVNTISIVKDKVEEEITEEIQPKKILVVDDSKDNQFVMKVLLKNFDYDLSYSDNGQEAYDSFLKNKYDLIIMDLQMPILDGHEATKKIRAYEIQNGLTPITILAATASTMEQDKLKALASGCDDLITKPLKKEELHETLQSYFSKANQNENINTKCEERPSFENDLDFSTEEFNTDLSEYLHTYITNRNKDLILLEKILLTNSTNGINEICHRVLGSAQTYGLNKLASVFSKLHSAGKSSDLENAKSQSSRPKNLPWICRLPFLLINVSGSLTFL